MSATALKIIKANYEARSGKTAELRAIDEAAEGRAYSDEEQAQVTELRSELSAIDERIRTGVEAEIRSAEITDAMGSLLGVLSREDGEVVDTRSLGEQFVSDDEFRAWTAGGARGASPALQSDMEFRAVTNVTTGSTSAGALYQNTRLSRVGNDFLNRRTFLLDLLPTIPVGTGSVEYVQDQSPLADFADKAAETTESSGTKPQAGPTLAVITEATATIAAWVNLTRQAAADAPQVRGYLDTKLRYSVKRRADAQSINGNGTSPNLKGLLNRSGIVTYAPGSAEARFVSIRHGIRLMEDKEAVPEIIVLNPADAEVFDLSNATTAGIHANPDAQGGLASSPTRTAWGLTQVRSTAIAAGTAMLVDPMALAVFDRQQVTAYMTDSHASNFTSNILTLLLEARLGLGLFDPAGVCSITFNGTT